MTAKQRQAYIPQSRKLKGNKIIYEIHSDTLGSFLSTADDLIASEIVVEKIINSTQK